jgi:hypothetical protein
MTSVLKPKVERDPRVIKVNKSAERERERERERILHAIACQSEQLFYFSAHKTQRVSFPTPSLSFTSFTTGVS